MAQEVNKLFDRVWRLASTLREKSGSGAEWKYTFPEGDTHTYKIRNIKSPEEIEDNIAHLFLWIWNAKDHLKILAREYGVDPQIVEKTVNDNEHLSLCGDIANRLKHGELSKSRSGAFPKLDRLKYTIPQKGIGSIVFRSYEVEVDVSNSESVVLSLAILAHNGDVVGDAFDTLSAGISAFEEVLQKILKDTA